MLEYDLLEGPAALHPSLEVLFDLLVAHLPTLNLLADSARLALHRLHLDRQRVEFDLAHSLNHFLKLEFSPPCILQLFFKPQCDRVDLARLTGLLSAQFRCITDLILLIRCRSFFI